MTASIPDDEYVEAPPEALPLDAWHRAQGARMVPFAGYEMPIQYEGIMPEHLWVREHAGLFDVSHMGQLIFSAETLGVGVDEELEALLPADLSSLPPCRHRYSLLLGPDGGILDDLMVVRLPFPSPFASITGSNDTGVDRFYMVVNGATKWDDIAYLREYLSDDVIINHMSDQALLALQGPEAAGVLARFAPETGALTFMTAAMFEIADVPAWISRSGYTGEDGFEISIPAEDAEKVAEVLCAQPEVRPIGLGARDSLRLEAGLPLYGHDLDPETTPIAADLGFALSKRRREEGGFPGHARITAERAAGPALKRVGLIVEGRQPVREGAAVVGGGRVTSGGFSPTLQQPIAMAYVPAAATTPGTKIALEQRGKSFTGVVTAMPFVPHRYHRKGA